MYLSDKINPFLFKRDNGAVAWEYGYIVREQSASWMHLSRKFRWKYRKSSIQFRRYWAVYSMPMVYAMRKLRSHPISVKKRKLGISHALTVSYYRYNRI